jgi:hypothetical protein
VPARSNLAASPDIVAADDALAAVDEFNEWDEQNNGPFAGPLVEVVSQFVRLEHGASLRGDGSHVRPGRR